jgi:hypothetical protein
MIFRGKSGVSYFDHKFVNSGRIFEKKGGKCRSGCREWNGI